MVTILGWSLAAILAVILLVVQWSWRRHAMESLAQGEFVAILFLQPEAYENNRKVYLEWAAGLPRELEFVHSVAGAKAAQNMALSFIAKLGQGVGLFSVLTEYKQGTATGD
jgi:hypothetical protein